MKTYIVGGYVRDTLLGLNPRDRDWVVVNASIEHMLKQGFHRVGKDFPVFLHPESKEEYALARRLPNDRQHHDGRKIYVESGAHLEQDLQRRDLTINAMAMTKDGCLIDPFGGQSDLQKKILRHVSVRFRDDPIRLLRTARFAAKYQFDIAKETLDLCRDMVAVGELENLVAERVWTELFKALSGPDPARFILELRNMHALKIIFPEIDRLFGVPQPEKHHPEIDTGAHLLLALKQAAELSTDPLIRFGVLVHDLGKGITPKDIWPRHTGHERAGVKLVEQMCIRWRVPTKYRQFGRICSEYHLHIHRAFELKAKTWVKLFEKIGALKDPEGLTRFLLVCQADAQGRKDQAQTPYPQSSYANDLLQAALSVSTSDILKRGVSGKAFGEKLRSRRVQAVRHCMSTFARE